MLSLNLLCDLEQQGMLDQARKTAMCAWQCLALYLWNTVNYGVDDIHALQEIACPVLVKDAKLQVMTL